MFESQKNSQGSKEVLDYFELLECLDLRVRAAENTVGKSECRHQVVTPGKKTVSRPSYAVIIDDTCVSCRKAKHPLYTCKTFQALSHECKMGVVKDNKLHLNCLGSGHFLKECPSNQRCKKCHRSHHLWQHIDSKSEDHKAVKAGSHSRDSMQRGNRYVSQTMQHKQVLLTTCKVQILGPDGSTTQARALSTSLITECLAQRLGLKRKRLDVSISGIGGNPRKLLPLGTVDFRITSVRNGEHKLQYSGYPIICTAVCHCNLNIVRICELVWISEWDSLLSQHLVTPTT